MKYCYDRLFSLFWCSSLLERRPADLVHFSHHRFSSLFYHFSYHTIITWAFIVLQALHSFSDFLFQHISMSASSLGGVIFLNSLITCSLMSLFSCTWYSSLQYFVHLRTISSVFISTLPELSLTISAFLLLLSIDVPDRFIYLPCLKLRMVFFYLPTLLV